ncbi:MAG: hypothetical protein AAF357_18725, partial [Verrucomicrobiota bacterium]
RLRWFIGKQMPGIIHGAKGLPEDLVRPLRDEVESPLSSMCCIAIPYRNAWLDERSSQVKR